MPDPPPIKLGTIIVFARIVVLGDGSKAFSVTKYSTPDIRFRCRVPFDQSSGIVSNVFVRPEDSSVLFPPVEGSDADGECDIEGLFLKYEFKEGNIKWVVVDQNNVVNKGVRVGRLSEVFRQPIG